MKKSKKPLLFSLAMLPVSLIAIYFTVLYQFDLYDKATIELLVSQIGSMELVMVVTLVQNCAMIFAACFLGHILAGKLGLLCPIRFEKRTLGLTGILAVVSGSILALDYWTFGSLEPMIRESTSAGMTACGVTASILYGGIVEELLLRLFMMSLIAWALWKLFARKQETCPEGILVAANIVAALLFAAGHLPATVMTFGALSPMLLFRCFLLNGGFGLVFGWLYRKYGLQYSMLCHAGAHIASKLIWFFFT